jgi:hypothetical protein
MQSWFDRGSQVVQLQSVELGIEKLGPGFLRQVHHIVLPSDRHRQRVGFPYFASGLQAPGTYFDNPEAVDHHVADAYVLTPEFNQDCIATFYFKLIKPEA